MNYTWEHYANKARQIAKHIVTGDEVNKDGVRLIQVVYKLDIYATDALNMKYAEEGSKSSVHTYKGGMQEITTEHSDGTQGLFKSNGQYQPTENNMDKDILNYMNKNLGESIMKKDNKVRLTESQLQNIIKESVKKVLREGLYDFDSTRTDEVQDNQENVMTGYFACHWPDLNMITLEKYAQAFYSTHDNYYGMGMYLSTNPEALVSRAYGPYIYKIDVDCSNALNLGNTQDNNIDFRAIRQNTQTKIVNGRMMGKTIIANPKDIVNIKRIK